MRFDDEMMTDHDAVEQRWCVISDPERERLEYAILEKWDYDPVHYWYPLNGGFDESRLFLNADRVEPYLEQLRRLLGLPDRRIYEYGEGCREASQLAWSDDLYGYGGYEQMYLPEDLSWAIYFSHENTVTFAGTILPMVKELLSPEQEHWNKWD